MHFPCCAGLFNNLTMYFSVICSKCFKMSRNLKKEAWLKASGNVTSSASVLVSWGPEGGRRCPLPPAWWPWNRRGCRGVYELPVTTERRAWHLCGHLLHFHVASGLVPVRLSVGPSQRAGAQSAVRAPGPLSPRPVCVHGCTQMVPGVDTRGSPGLTGGPVDSEVTDTELTPLCRAEGLENGIRLERNTYFVG